MNVLGLILLSQFVGIWCMVALVAWYALYRAAAKV